MNSYQMLNTSVRYRGIIVSLHFAEFCGHRSCGSSETVAKIFYVTLQDHVTKDSGDFMEGNSIAHHHAAKTDSHWHCVNGYITVSVCHMILQDHVIRWSCDSMGRSLLRYGIILPSLLAIGTAVVEDIVSVCHVILLDHVINGSCHLWAEGYHVTTLPGLIAIDIPRVEIGF